MGHVQECAFQRHARRVTRHERAMHQLNNQCSAPSHTTTTRRRKVGGGTLLLVSTNALLRGPTAGRSHLHLHLRGHLRHLRHLRHLCHLRCHARTTHHAARHTRPHVTARRQLLRRCTSTPRHAATASSPLSATPAASAAPAAPPRCLRCRCRLCRFIRRRRSPSAARPASSPVVRARTPVIFIVVAFCSASPSPISGPRVAGLARWGGRQVYRISSPGFACTVGSSCCSLSGAQGDCICAKPWMANRYERIQSSGGSAAVNKHSLTHAHKTSLDTGRTF